jgi:hypothetical protein
MSRVIRPESGAATRKKLLRHVSSAIKQAASGTTTEGEQLDILAFLALSLTQVEQSVQQTVTAWEDRGYWVKADRFNLDWGWAGRNRAALEEALMRSDFIGAAQVAVDIATHLTDYNPYKTSPRQRPWQGSWDRWHEQNQ